jgi:hypothetical protein
MQPQIKAEIRAAITLVPTELGGRHSTIFSGEYRGVLVIGDEHFSARFKIPEGTSLEPGRTMDVEIQFLFPETALPRFPIGEAFTIWEGRDIGFGRVTGVIGEDDQRSIDHTPLG